MDSCLGRRSASRSVLLGAALLCFAGLLKAAPRFPNPVYSVGYNPQGMAMADVDGDGIQDIIVSNFGDGYDGGPGDLSLLRGRGDGTFADEMRIPTEQHPLDVLAADVNQDGRPDLILLYLDSAVVMAGRGNGTFGAERTAVSGIFSVALANFNNDGKPDLLVENIVDPSSFQAYLGNGDGTFRAAPSVSPGYSAYTRPGDINGDGFDDMVTATFDPSAGFTPNEILIFFGAGDGTFTLSGRFATGEYSSQLFVQDIDGDGLMDLAMNTIHQGDGGGSTGPFLIYFSRGDGTFEPGPSEPGVYNAALLAIDLDHDGRRDYVTTDGYEVKVYLGQGGRSFTPVSAFAAGVDMWRIAAGDFNRDGRNDLAFLANRSEAVFTYAGNGDGTFGPPRIPALGDILLNGAATADFNNDGRLDLVAATFVTDDVTVLLGNGDGTFGPPASFPAGVSPDFVATGDFNGDGQIDLVVLDANFHDVLPDPFPSASVSILLGNGDGTFGPFTSYEAGLFSNSMLVDDLDGDGALDVVVTNFGNGVDIPGDLCVLAGRGDGSLAPCRHWTVGSELVPFYGYTIPMGAATADLNGDGRRDISVAMSGIRAALPGALRILFAQTDGTFSAPVTVAETTSSSSVAARDLNGDGHQDLVVAEAESFVPNLPGGLYVLLGSGDGSFSTTPLLAAGQGPLDVKIADLTNDGITDLVASNNGGYVALLPGLGDGSFGHRLNFGLFGLPLATIRGDFTSDGLTDLLVVSTSGAFVLAQSGVPDLAVDASISFVYPKGKERAIVTWTTNAERDLAGFNVLLGKKGSHRKRLNHRRIACGECTTGLGHTYTFDLGKLKPGETVYIEAVHQDGRVETFGPASRP